MDGRPEFAESASCSRRPRSRGTFLTFGKGQMFGDPPERDWKYLRSVFDEMLEELSRQINDEVRAILARVDISENEKRGRIYDIVRKRDRVVAECFDDWRRSRLYERCWALKKHGLLKPEHIAKLTPESQRAISPFETP